MHSAFALASSTPWVNWYELWKTILIGLAAALGAVILFSLGLLALQAAGVGPRGRGTEGALRPLPMAAAVVCYLAVAAIVVGGIYITFKK